MRTDEKTVRRSPSDGREQARTLWQEFAVPFGRHDRAEEILTLLSDPTSIPGEDLSAPGKAVGAWRDHRDY